MTNLRAKVREYYARLDAGVTIPRHLCAPNMITHIAGASYPLDEAEAFGAAFYMAFPNLAHDVLGQVEASDYVTSRLRLRGKHCGDLGEYVPSGASINVSALVLHRFEQGLIAEQWVETDQLGLFRQIGIELKTGE